MSRKTALACLIVGAMVSCRRKTQPTPTVTQAPSASTSASASASASMSTKRSVPVDPVSSHLVNVALGVDRGCVSRADGYVVCFGPKGPPTLVQGVADAVQLFARNTYWCALHRQGFVTCWRQDAPERNVLALTRAIELGDSCVRHEDGRVSCWSYDPSGLPAAPSYLSSIGSARTLAHGRSNTHCIVRADQKISCWGENAKGQTGDETQKPRTSPNILPGLDDVEEVLVDERAGTCARIGDELTCWGGDWIPLKKRRGPYALPKGTMQVAMSDTHACARTIVGRLVCFAVNQAGAAPSVEIPGLDDVVHVAVGTGSTCVLTRRGKLLCWGSINDKKTPTEVALTLPN